MQVEKLGTRVFQIYIFTILLGTLITSVGMSLLTFDFGTFPLLLFFGFLVTGFLSLPNIFALNRGLKYIYKKAQDEGEKRRYFIYFWMILCAIPLFPCLFMSMGGAMYADFLELLAMALIPSPYIFSCLYFIFKINNKFDKIYPPTFTRNRIISEDLLDDDF